MKIKRYLFLVTFLAFFSCNNEIKKEIPNIIIQTPTVSPSAITKKQTETIIDETNVSLQRICLNLELKESELKMYKPYDVVPAKDGSYIYVIANYEKDSTFRYPSEFTFQDNSNRSKKSKVDVSINKPELVLYKITKDKKISLIKDFNYLGCDLNEIERKKDKELLILLKGKTYSFDNNIYQIELDNINKKISDYLDPNSSLRNPISFFYEDFKIYYSFALFRENYQNFDYEFIEEYNFDTEFYDYTYSNESTEKYISGFF